MELLVAQRLTRLRNGTELFSGVNLRLSAGDRVGLAGANGSGKSTLLRTLAGLEEPDGGAVWRAPGVRVGYLAQVSLELGAKPALQRTVWQAALRALSEVNALERRLRELERLMAHGSLQPNEYDKVRLEFERAGGFGAEANLRRELAAVGFSQHDDERRLGTLSSGERRRLALAQTLAARPDVLLLDEPTNHLDIAARVRLTQRLASWHGALVVVSHDRALLDESTTRTAFLEPSRAPAGEPSIWNLEPGNYTSARQRRAVSARSSHKREREQARESERLAKMAAELASFGKKAAARKRSAERRLDKLRATRVSLQTRQPRSATPHLATVQDDGNKGRAGQELLRAMVLSAAPVLEGESVTVRRGERIALLGPNGSGKSTLLALLAGVRRSDDPASEVRYLDGLRLRYLSQEGRGLDPEVPIWDQALARSGTVNAGRLLAGTGLGSSSWSRLPSELSGGERARAGLALALAEHADIWLIDEPTNDLDLAAVEALEQQLQQKLEVAGAALILATHDQRLAQSLTCEVWAVESGQIAFYDGVQEYLEGRRHETPGVQAAGTTASLTEVQPGSAADPSPAARLDEMEEQRAQLLRLRDEDTELTERDRLRLQTLLADIEGELMAGYEARLPRPAPKYRLAERGLALYADRLSDAADARLAVVAPQPALAAGAHSSEVQAAAAALEGLAAREYEVLAGCAPAWLEVRREGAIGHLRLVPAAEDCALGYVNAALANAGTRLAFTRLGVQAVQLHFEGELPGTLLEPAGSGWWSLGLGRFLELEGWRR